MPKYSLLFASLLAMPVASLAQSAPEPAPLPIDPSAGQPGPSQPSTIYPPAKPPKSKAPEPRNQFLMSVGAAGPGPDAYRATMRIEVAPYGKQALLVGWSAEEQVSTHAGMLVGMPISRRFGAWRAWVGPQGEISDTPRWLASGGLAREIQFTERSTVAMVGVNKYSNAWQWTMSFSILNQKW